jgi:pimeloyl-ACP methyl ester carboxylesterase
MQVDLGRSMLEAEDHGRGVPFILLHGFPLSLEIWAAIRPAVEQAARLVTPDLRGFGRSAKPQGDYSMESLAGDIVALADRLGLERFVLGGHSMGGYVAFRVAAAAPERLLGLVLVDTRAEADTAEGQARRDAAIERIKGGDGAGFLDEFVPNLVGPTTRRRAPRFVTDLRAIAGEIPSHVLTGCLAGMRDRPDSRDVLGRLEVPALVLVGEEDAVTSPESARAMTAALAGAVLAVIPGAGHTPSVERPIPTANAILEFLRRSFPKPAAIQLSSGPAGREE